MGSISFPMTFFSSCSPENLKTGMNLIDRSAQLSSSHGWVNGKRVVEVLNECPMSAWGLGWNTSCGEHASHLGTEPERSCFSPSPSWINVESQDPLPSWFLSRNLLNVDTLNYLYLGIINNILNINVRFINASVTLGVLVTVTYFPEVTGYLALASLINSYPWGQLRGRVLCPSLLY